jgi:hypothetical protein
VYNLKHRILLDKKTTKFFSVFVNQVGTECNFTTKDSWTILSPIEQSIKKKIEKVGTPLKDWNINIYRGILTGYNKAFIIDGITKDKLINEDAKSAEIIRPILRGRDIKRYSYEFADLYLITTFPSLKIDIEEYPAVKAHLLSFGYDRLKQTGEKGARKKTNNKWFETQDSIAYWEDFNRQKIMYSEIVKEPQFYLDNAGEFFPEATTFILTGNHLEYLCNMFNSKTIAYAFKTFYAGGGLGESGYRYKKVFFEKLPIPKFDNNKIQQQIKNAQITNNIESLIFKLYGFNSYEISEIEQI